MSKYVEKLDKSSASIQIEANDFELYSELAENNIEVEKSTKIQIDDTFNSSQYLSSYKELNFLN